MEKQGWNVFRSIPRNSDNFEPRWTLLFAQISKVKCINLRSHCDFSFLSYTCVYHVPF